MSLADLTGTPSPSDKLPPLECSPNIRFHRFRKLSIWWWESNDSHSGASYHTSGSSSRDNLYYVAFDAACSVPMHHLQRL